uniref:Uncharacterized protein n=1 Tax=Oryza sativa subsp. japonica TaxID=39947 RepID=Q6YZP5_ORYSJ|nr:hypothetical protein [Oryza sativa Japonica Group]BAD03739.1 hypothetical protein [Oryza sativa Japonica Group]
MPPHHALAIITYRTYKINQIAGIRKNFGMRVFVGRGVNTGKFHGPKPIPPAPPSTPSAGRRPPIKTTKDTPLFRSKYPGYARSHCPRYRDPGSTEKIPLFRNRPLEKHISGMVLFGALERLALPSNMACQMWLLNYLPLLPTWHVNVATQVKKHRGTHLSFSPFTHLFLPELSFDAGLGLFAGVADA